MNKLDIAHIVHEVRSIPYFETRIREFDSTLQRLSDELLVIGGTHCPQANSGPQGNCVPRDSRIIEVLSEEAYYEDLKKHYKTCLSLAKDFKAKLVNACDESWEKEFLIDFLKGWSYEKLKIEYGITNVYLTVCRIVKRIDF